MAYAAATPLPEHTQVLLINNTTVIPMTVHSGSMGKVSAAGMPAVVSLGRQRRAVASLEDMCSKAIGKYLGQHYGNNAAAMRKFLKDSHVPEHLMTPILKYGMSAALQEQREVVAQKPADTKCHIQ